jgi:secreted trypsin-like serine protease
MTLSDVKFDANTANKNEDTIDTVDYDPLDKEFCAIDTFVNNLAVAKQQRYLTTKLAKVGPPDGCVNMSTYCTQNAHGLWRLATDVDGKRLSNQP